MSDDSANLPASPKERTYTVSEAALAQRRAAAKRSTGPRTEEGKAASSRNSWKHGGFSHLAKRARRNGFGDLSLRQFGKPCQTTCPIHPDNPTRTLAPCSLVVKGHTKAGESCLDKTVYVDAFDAIIVGLQERDPQYLHGIMAAELAAALQLLHDLRDSVWRDGINITIPVVSDKGEVVKDDDGKPVPFKVVLNPAIPQVWKALEVLGMNMPELLLTPRAHEKDRGEQEQAGAMQTLVAGIFQRGNGARALPRPESDE